VTTDACELQSWYHVHHVTREEFEKKVAEQRKFDLLETGGRLDAEQRAKTTFSQRANALSTGKRALQAAAAIRIETDTEQSLAKVGLFIPSRVILIAVVVHQVSVCSSIFGLFFTARRIVYK